MSGGDDSEEEALLSKSATTSRRVGAGPSPSAQLATCIGAWFAASIGLTLGNKAAFSGALSLPCPLLITSFHIGIKALLAQSLLTAARPHKHSATHTYAVCAQIVPVGLATALDIGLSNMSLQFVSVTMYTIIKSSSPLWILVISVILGLQQPRPVLVLVVASVAAGIVLAAAPAWEEVPVPPSGWPPPAPPLAAADAGGADSASSFDPARETRKALLWLTMDGDDATSVPLPFLRHALARHFGTARQAPPASPARATMWRGGLTHETTLGMLLVLAASVCGAFRWAWMELLLRPAATVRAATCDERRGDMAGSLATALQQPLSLVRATASLGFCTMLPIALWLETVSIVAAVETHLDRDYTSGLLLRAGMASLAGGLLAFCMLLVELRIVQLASSLTLSVAGTLKEVLTVGASVLILGDELTWRKAAGLTLCIAGIFCYNQIKGKREEG